MKIKCPACEHEHEISPGAELGRMKKTVSPESIAARTENARKPRPGAVGKKKPRKPKDIKG